MLTTLLEKLATLTIVLSLVCLVWALLTRKSRRESVRREGIKAGGNKVWATLISKQPTGESTGSDTQVQYAVQYYVLLELDVPQPDGTTARCTIKDLPAPGWQPLEPGDQVQVYQQPDNPTQVTLDTIMTPHYSKRA